jgi:hypothetical protein
MMDTPEQKTAQTVLQQPEEITVGGETFSVAPPSIATLILASAEISKLPHVKLDSENILLESLAVAKNCRVLGDVTAILILGAKGLTGKRKVIETVEKRRFFGFLKETESVETEIVIDRKADLSRKLLEDVTPRELFSMTIRMLNTMQVSDFFGFTTSLIEVNLLRQTTGEVVNETTAFGQS